MAGYEKDFVRNFLGMHRQMERFLSDAFRSGHPSAFSGDASWCPPVDVFETEDAYIVKMELAGVGCEDLEITYDHGQLTVEGCRHDAFSQAKVTCHQMEIPYGNFRRTIFISRNTDARGITATYDAGLLEIRIPRADKHPQDKVRIKVE